MKIFFQNIMKQIWLTLLALAIFFIFLLSFCFLKLSPTFSNLDEQIVSVSSTVNYHNSLVDAVVVEQVMQEIKNAPDVGKVSGAIVPHHLLASYLPATLFEYLKKQEPSLIVLIGPNHKNTGRAPVTTSILDWQTPDGVLLTNKKIVESLVTKNFVAIDEEIIGGEHSLGNLIPFIKKSLPNTKVLSLAIKYQTPTATLDTIYEYLKDSLPSDAVIIGSVDFSHYLRAEVANFHDELSRAVINNFDYERLDILDIDSSATVYLTQKLLENKKSQKVVYSLSNNSAEILKRPDLEQTTSYYSPWFGQGDTTNDKTASLLFFGDMMLERYVEKNFSANGGPDYLFSELAGEENRFFMGTDIVHANLEGPFADTRRFTTKEIAFRFDPKIIPTLLDYRFSIFNLANNHTLDMGTAGFEESKKNLTEAGIDFYGAQYAVDDKSVLVKDIAGLKVAFFGFNDTNSPLSIPKISELVSDTLADFKIINIHWGAEYKEISNERQRLLGRALIDAGADVIIGHHPHVVQEMEIYKDRPIFYSLGNFIFDQYFSQPTQEGLAVGVVANKKPTDERFLSLYVFPLESIKSQPRQMKFEKALETMYNITQRSRLSDYEFDNFKLEIQLNK